MNCYWRLVEGPTCYGGQLWEYWEYYCCDGSGCSLQYGEWRVVGSCDARRSH